MRAIARNSTVTTWVVGVRSDRDLMAAAPKRVSFLNGSGSTRFCLFLYQGINTPTSATIRLMGVTSNDIFSKPAMRMLPPVLGRTPVWLPSWRAVWSLPRMTMEPKYLLLTGISPSGHDRSVFTVSERDRVRDHVLRLARSDSRVVAGAVVGS